MNRVEALALLRESRIARLATVRPDGRPHVVPVTFAMAGDRLVTMVDHKPKTTHRLQRLANIEESGVASLVVDHYEEDWSKLWWVRVDGVARVEVEGDDWREAADALVGKYEAYQTQPPSGPAIILSVEHVSYWASTP